MGARFDKWLARPSTLHFLRQLIGPDHPPALTRRPHPTALLKRRARCFATAIAAIPQVEDVVHGSRHQDAKTHIPPETYHEQRRRVAKELKLRIPKASGRGESFESPAEVPSPTSYAEILSREAHVRFISSTRGLLVDHPDNFANLEAWSQILQYRERVDGFKGVSDVWDGMRRRGINLPVEGELAGVFWTTFLHAAIVERQNPVHKRLLREVYGHAEDLKAAGYGHYRSLHKLLVGRFLRETPGSVKDVGPEYEWHLRCHNDGFYPKHALVELVEDVFQSRTRGLVFNRFRKIYKDHGERNLYDLCMPLVFKHAANDEPTIIRWHNFFVWHKDMPSTDMQTYRSIQYLLGSQKLKHRIEPGDLANAFAADRGDPAKSIYPSLSRASMNSLVGDVHGIKPKAISDKFCARMFATHAFPLEAIIRGIAMLGTEALGPTAMRELAVRSASLETFKKRLADVQDAGMEIVPSIYTRLLTQVANNSQHDLFQALLDSDQHPESYDDQHMQEALLTEFLDSKNLEQAHLTLMGLSQADFEMADRAWNRLFQHYIQNQDHAEIVRIFNQMCSEQMEISRRTLNFLTKYLLAERSPGKRPMVSSRSPDGAFVSIDFVTNAHMYAVERGTTIHPTRWIEILKRYGMSGNINGLARLAPWLAEKYPAHHKDVYYTHDGNKLRREISKKSPQASILNPVMLRAFVLWGFKHAAARDKLQTRNIGGAVAASFGVHELWARGLVLLLQLKELGVHVQTVDVRRALEEILWILFGPAVTKRNDNLEAMRNNKLTLEHYIEHANELWDEPIFDIAPDIVVDRSPEGKARLLSAVFGRQRLADQKTGTWVDVDAWAASQSQGYWHQTPPFRKARSRVWSRSPFQFTDGMTRNQRRSARLHRPRREGDTLLPVDQALTPQHQSPAAPPLSLYRPPNQPDIPEET